MDPTEDHTTGTPGAGIMGIMVDIIIIGIITGMVITGMVIGTDTIATIVHMVMVPDMATGHQVQH